jgi:hypothetical protein
VSILLFSHTHVYPCRRGMVSTAGTMSWSEIALDMAKLVAAQRGCSLERLSIDGVEIDQESGVEIVRIQAHASMARLPDEIPFDWGDDEEASSELPIAQ